MYFKLINLIFIFIFLRPHLKFLSPVLATYLGDIVIVVIILFGLITCKFKAYRQHRNLMKVSIEFLFVILIITSINFFKTGSSIRVFLDYFKIMYFIISFWFIYSILLMIPNKLELINNLLNKVFIIIFIVATIQLFDFPLIGNFVKSIYGSIKLRSLWGGYPRIYSTFFNANWFGVYLVFYLSWLNVCLLYKSIGYNFYILRIFMLIILFIVSGSRTAMIGASISLIIFVTYFKKIGPVSVISLLLLGLGQIIRKVSFMDRTLNRFSSLFMMIKDGGRSMTELNSGRAYSWNVTLQEIKKNPLLGSGNIDGFIAHNSYLYFLNAFGIIGVIFLISFLVIFLYSCKINKKSEEYKFVEKWLIIFIPAFLIMSLSAEFMFTTQVMLMVILIYSLKFSLMYNN